MKAAIKQIEKTHINLMLQLFRQEYYNVKILVEGVEDYNMLEELLNSAVYSTIIFRRWLKNQRLDCAGSRTKIISGQTFPIFGYQIMASIAEKDSNAEIILYMPNSIIAGVMNYMSREFEVDEEYKKIVDEYSYRMILTSIGMGTTEFGYT